MVLVNFIRDPEVGIFARVKRRPKDRGAADEGQGSPDCSKD